MKKTLFLLFTLINLSVSGQIGDVTTYSGSISGSQNGPIGSAQFRSPAGIAFDSSGNMYVADYDNNVIRKIDTNGNVTTFSGIFSLAAGYVDGPASSARFSDPYDIAIDANGNLYVTDAGNGRIRKIDTNGNVTTIAGQGLGNGVIDGNGTSASMSITGGIVVDNLGNIYFTDNIGSSVNGKIRKIDTAGNVTTIAGINNGNYNDGLGNAITISQPYGLELDGNGNLYFSEVDRNRIRKLNIATNMVTTIAGSGIAGGTDGVGFNATLNGPIALTLENNSLYFNDRFSHNVRKINLINNQVVTIAGSGTSGSTNGAGAAASFNAPTGIASRNNELFIGDFSNNRIRKITISYIGGNSCAVATDLPNNSGTINIGTIIGTAPVSTICFTYSQANPNANWWSFTPTQNGILDITTVTPQNSSTTDTRISIFTGTCSTLTCFSGNDNVSTTDLRSSINDLILTAGTTYYFVFDDKVSDNAAVNFFYEFTPQTCFVPSGFSLFSPTTQNSIHFQWVAPTLGDTSLDSYTIEIGPRNYTRGSAQTISSATVSITNHNFTGLTQGTVYDMYIKSDCSTSDNSVWRGPIQTATAFAPVNPTYTENFDSETTFSFLGLGRFSSTTNANWRFQVNGPSAFVYNGTNSVFSISDSAALTNAYLFTKPINLIAGQTYNINFFLNDYLTTGNTTQYQVDVLVGSNINSTTPADYNIIWTDFNTQVSNTFISKNATFTPLTTGAYRFAIRNSSQSTGTGLHYLFVDNLIISTTLSIDDFNKSTIVMYPNPVLDYITLQNPDIIQINNYSVIDMNGRVLISSPYIVSNNTIDLTSLSKGVYFIQLDTERGILSKKIIKE